MTYDHDQLFDKLDRILSEAPQSKISEIVIALQIDRHTIEKVVLMEAGMTFRRFRGDKLCKHCLQLLEREGLSSEKEIAAKAGFSSTAAFSHFVKRHTGKTPTQLR
jgi:AraC-like DNA-binding protein